MTKAEIIKHIDGDNWFIWTCRSVAPVLADDLYQDMALLILDMPDEKIEQIGSTCIKCWYVTVLKNAIKSNREPFKKYNLKGVQEWNGEVIEEGMGWDADRVAEVVKGLPLGDQDLVDEYVKQGSCRAVNLSTSIPKSSVQRNMKRIREQIKRNYDSN